MKLRDLTGQKFGILTVVERAPNRKKATMWKCNCDCGNEYVTYSTHLVNGTVTNCGCKLNKRGPAHHQWAGTDIISGNLWSILKRSLRNRESRKILDFDIDIEFATELFHKQKGMCALSGVELITYPNNKTTASLDRIDSKKGYTKDNVQWVHKDVNRMKNAYDEDYFIDFCKKIASHKSGGACEV